jgi:hypothetical protein
MKDPNMLAHRAASFAAVIATIGGVLATTACSGTAGTVSPTSQGGQELTKRVDGTPTGNGQTCSWEGTAVAAGTTPPAPPSYSVGASFPSPDGCNECSCSPQGIMCTMRPCAPAAPPLCNAVPKCAPGEHVDQKTCTCVLDAGGCNAFPECASGEHVDENTCTCVLDAGGCNAFPQCSQGQHVDDKTCSCVPDGCSDIPACPSPRAGCGYGAPVCTNGVATCGPLVCV